jgi:predicted small lipoprotein YifL
MKIERMNIRWLIAVMMLLLTGCAEKGPVLLGNIKYQAPEKTVAGSPKTIVGVSPFKDLRGAAASVLGKRTIRNYVENDLVVQGTVADLVTAAFKDALRSRGFAVKDAPAWDMKTETIAGDGFNVLIGGEIKALWVEVTSQPLNVQERAEVQLRVSAADTSDKTIFKTLNMNSKLERQDLAFSFETVEGMLSEALSSAIDQLLKDDEFKKKIH